jgi:hypothetical protein
MTQVGIGLVGIWALEEFGRSWGVDDQTRLGPQPTFREKSSQPDVKECRIGAPECDHMHKYFLYVLFSFALCGVTVPPPALDGCLILAVRLPWLT